MARSQAVGCGETVKECNGVLEFALQPGLGMRCTPSAKFRYHPTNSRSGFLTAVHALRLMMDSTC
jgi:hypothetical protein